MTHTTTDFQRRLIALGYLAAGQDDGKFGAISLDAYNHYRAAKGFGPVNGASMAQLDQDLFPEDYAHPASNPLDNPIVRIGLSVFLSQLKGLPMLTGYKTYASAAVLVIMAIYSIVFGDLPLVGHVDPGSAIMALLSGLGLTFARTGAKTEAAKAVDNS